MMCDDELASILLIDDNPANLLAVETILADLGQNLVKAHSGREALRRLLVQDFAVIITDVNMPDMDGFETASLIRQRPRSEHTPIVFLTAISQTDAHAAQGYGLGAVDYIYTPVAPEVLRAKVRVFVDLFRMNRVLARQSKQLARANDELGQRLGESAAYVQEIERLNKDLQVTVAELDRDVAERKRAEAALRASEERLQILHEVDRAILAAQSPDGIVQAVVCRLRQVIPCDWASVLLFDLPAMRGQILATDTDWDAQLGTRGVVSLEGDRLLAYCKDGRTGVVEDLAELADLSPLEQALVAEGMHAYAGIPLMANGRLIGALRLGREQPGSFPDGCIDLASQAADSLAVAIQNARLNQQVEVSRSQLQKLSRRLVEIQESERRAIARELHDEAGQALTSLMLGLGLLEREGDCTQALAHRVEGLKQVTNDVMEELHRLAVNLRPASLDRLGLVPALEQYIASISHEGALEIKMAALGLERKRLPLEVETSLYRMIQEALTNVIRHARATHAGVVVQRKGSRVVSTIEDDGIGFDVEVAIQHGRLGLIGMRERIEMLGGKFTIESRPGVGTTVFAEIQCDDANPDVPAQPPALQLS